MGFKETAPKTFMHGRENILLEETMSQGYAQQKQRTRMWAYRS
jgi:hypothetical protein